MISRAENPSEAPDASDAMSNPEEAPEVNRGVTDAAPSDGAPSESESGESEPTTTEPAEEVPPLEGDALKLAAEAVLFSSAEPVTVRQLAEAFEVSVHDVREAVEELRLDLVDQKRSFRLQEVGGGLQLVTDARHFQWVSKFYKSGRAQRLSPASLESLSVIAYKQPISKADLKGIRGVQCGPTLKTLLDRGLIKIVGREESLGRPLLYGTTQRFLESFGIASLKSLPEPDLEGFSEAGAELEGE